MLEDHALCQCFSTRGGEIKLQYNIFTNIMTRMLSHVKKYIGYINKTVPPLYVFCVSEQHIFLIVCNTDWTVAQKRCIYIIWYANYSSWMDKRSQCHTSTHKCWWTTIVIKEEMITVTGSCIRSALCPLWCTNELCMRSRLTHISAWTDS